MLNLRTSLAGFSENISFDFWGRFGLNLVNLLGEPLQTSSNLLEPLTRSGKELVHVPVRQKRFGLPKEVRFNFVRRRCGSADKAVRFNKNPVGFSIDVRRPFEVRQCTSEPPKRFAVHVRYRGVCVCKKKNSR